MQQYFSSYVDGINGSASVPTTSQSLHEMARGMTKHLTMHPGEGWTTESQNASTTPEGWTMATRLSMIGIQSSPTLYSEMLVTVPMTGNATTDAQAAVNAAVQDPGAAQAATAVLVGAGAWQGDTNSLIVSIIYQHQ